MNKLVKKSLAGVLAGVMAATSLVGSLTAMAAIDQEYIKNSAEYTLGQKVSFEKTGKEGEVLKTYAFTTGAETVKDSKKVKLTLDFSSDAYVPNATTKERTEGAAVLLVAELKEDKTITPVDLGEIKSFTKGTSSSQIFIDPKGNEKVLVPEIFSYNDYHADIELKEKTTYLFKVETFGSYTVKENNQDVKKYTNAYMTISNYVAPEEEIFQQDGAIVDKAYDVTLKEYANGSKDVERTTTPTVKVKYIGTDSNIVVPETFKGARVTEVTGLAVPAVVKNRITSLTLGKYVQKVSGFSNCPSLTKVVFNDALEEIAADAFAHDTGLTGELVIPASVTTIGTGAFYDTNYDCAKITNEKTTVGGSALGVVEALNEATANPYDTKVVVKDGFFITAPAKAAAVIAYGKTNAIPVIDPAACTHVFGDAEVKAATYWAKGSETKTCKVCGAVETKEIAQKKVAISTVKSAKKGQITVKTKKVDAAIKGYKIQYATKKDFSNAKTVKVATTKKALSKTIKGLKAGKKYYVRVRVYKSGTNGAWSAAKTVKVKK